MKLAKLTAGYVPYIDAEYVLKFIPAAEAFANCSKNPKRKVGALIIGKGNTVIAQGWNDLPRGVEHRAERYEQPLKDLMMAHAERNAICNAARVGVATDGATMLVTGLMPCAHCAQAIIGAGIKRVVYPVPKGTEEKWSESFDAALQMLIEAGIEIETYEETEDATELC